MVTTQSAAQSPAADSETTTASVQSQAPPTIKDLCVELSKVDDLAPLAQADRYLELMAVCTDVLSRRRQVALARAFQDSGLPSQRRFAAQIGKSHATVNEAVNAGLAQMTKTIRLPGDMLMHPMTPEEATVALERLAAEGVTATIVDVAVKPEK